MSNFPSDYDNDITLPFVNDNLTEIGGEAINASRDAIINLEYEVGIGASGSTGSIANRLGVSLNPDGSIKSSAITSLGLVTLPITQDQIANNAGIPESKLKLDHRTQDLFNYVRDLSKDVNLAIGWISVTGIKLEPHLAGAIYRHTMNQIDVTSDLTNYPYLNNRFGTVRDNLQAYNLVNDINNELLEHQWADGSASVPATPIFTNDGSQYPATYAHTGTGIFLNTSRFSTIPQTAQDVQKLAEFIDNSSLFLLGTRIQNFYTGGISRVSRSGSLTEAGDGYVRGTVLVPSTSCTTYLKNLDNSSSPFDDINTGDDIIEFTPPQADIDSNAFDAKFALVKPGDIIRVNYGNVEVPFVIKEKKYNQNAGNKKYIVRIVGKNLQYSTTATAKINKPLFNKEKYGVLAVAAANNNFLQTPSLIVTSPRGSETLGIGFNAAQLDSTHYLLYLALYPTGHPQDGYTILPGIDVTGNQGETPGLYTLDSIVEATNNAFRQSGYNYRFIAFSYQGEFGIMLADSYNNAGFSILNGVMNGDGTFNQAATELTFPNNVIDLFPSSGLIAPDPLGFGYYGSASASPPYQATYDTAEASLNPTKVFLPLSKKNFYVNGIEKERLNLEEDQALDGYGDGYWVGTIFAKQVFPGPVPAGRVQTTYRINTDLSTTGLQIGKTIVVQTISSGGLVDSGRFIIQDISFGCTPTIYTDITVYDAVHAKGFSPTTTLGLNAQVKIYFSSDSVSFNAESATDFSAISPFKRHFEVYIDENSFTFTHERGRVNISGGTVTVNNVDLYGDSPLNKIDIVRISPKLRGYQFGSVNKITLFINDYNTTTGVFNGYLCSYDGVTPTEQGPLTFGKKGEVVRFYDQTNIDYIDLIFDINTTIASFTNHVLDFQLFPTLTLDDEINLLATCQLDDTTKKVTHLIDNRQFGNTSEKDLSSSVFNYFAAPERLLHSNGVVRGFDIKSVDDNVIKLDGGTALVNGKLLNINHDTISIPLIAEQYAFNNYGVLWALCVNDRGELELIPLLDNDPLFNTPNDPTRIFVAKDAVSLGTYNIPATTFSDLVNDKVHLTVLYVVFASMYPALDVTTINLNVTDSRKYVYKKDWGEVPILSSDGSNGDFRSFTALNEWFSFHTTYTNTATIKGAFVVPPLSLSYDIPIVLNGDGTATFTISSSQTISTLELNKVSVVANAPLSIVSSTINQLTISGTSSLSFSNSRTKFCNISNTGNISASSSKFDNVVFTITAGTSITFTDCILTNCTFNINSNASITFTGSTSVVDSNIFNINNASATISATRKIINNTFNYVAASSNNILLSGELSVTNNYFIATVSALTTQFLSVSDGSNGIIVDNAFYRGSNTLQAYILAPASYTSGAVTVSNNFFDSSTFNGTDQKLVKNLPLTWIYTKNVNTPPSFNVRTVTGSSYSVAVSDEVLNINLSTAISINLPNVANSINGRKLIIKDTNGSANTNPITLVRAVATETIEGLAADYIYSNPFGSITLVADLTIGGWVIV